MGGGGEREAGRRGFEASRQGRRGELKTARWIQGQRHGGNPDEMLAMLAMLAPFTPIRPRRP